MTDPVTETFSLGIEVIGALGLKRRHNPAALGGCAWCASGDLAEDCPVTFSPDWALLGYMP